MRFLPFTIGFAAAFVATVHVARAQAAALGQTVKLADGVYEVLLAPGPVADANVLVIINEEDVVVVDSNILPAGARAVIGEIRKLTSKPVRYVVNTHWHSDHHYGNDTYAKEFPGVEFIQHANTRRDIVARDIPALGPNIQTNYPAQLARLRQALETGKTSAGVTVTDTMRRDFTALATYYETFIREMSSSRVVPGTLIVNDSLVLHRGERRIVIKYLGKGNTEGDLVVHLPKERIVATGDLVVHPIPFSFYSFLGDWPATLRALTRLDATTIVPGHGEIQRDWAYVDRLSRLIDTTWVQVRAAVRSGATNLDSVRARVNVATFREQFAGSDERRRRQFNAFYFMPATEAAFRELRPDSTSRR